MSEERKMARIDGLPPDYRQKKVDRFVLSLVGGGYFTLAMEQRLNENQAISMIFNLAEAFVEESERRYRVDLMTRKEPDVRGRQAPDRRAILAERSRDLPKPKPEGTEK